MDDFIKDLLMHVGGVSHRVVLLFHHIIREGRVVVNVHRVFVVQPVIIRGQTLKLRFLVRSECFSAS